MSVNFDKAREHHGKERRQVAVDTGTMGAHKIRILTKSDKSNRLDQLVQVSAHFKTPGALQSDPQFTEAKKILQAKALQLLTKYERTGQLSGAKLGKLQKVLENLGLSQPEEHLDDIAKKYRAAFHDDNASKMFLDTFRALHLGGKKTAESRLIISAVRPIQKNLLREIERVLSASFDLSQTPISTISPISGPERRNRIMRIEFKNSQSSVIFKESHPQILPNVPTNPAEMKREAYERFSKDWAGLEFASTLHAESPLCPKFYGASKDHLFILLQDLGKTQDTLATHLLGEYPSVATASLERYLTCLGRFHAAGHAEIGRYLEILRGINPEAPPINIADCVKTSLHQLKSLLARLKVPYTKELQEEVQRVIESTLNPEGPFATVTHGDPCPDNVFDYPDKLLLIDFECAEVKSALLDATYPRMSMPSGWCAGRVPGKLLEPCEARYRQELSKQIPEASDDKVYFEAYAQACALHLLKSEVAWLIDECFEKDYKWGPFSERSRALTHLDTFISISEQHDTLPALRTMAIRLIQTLTTKWPDAKPLELYPAYR
jgi:hypothetical protein